MSNTYLDWAKRNFELNGLRGKKHELVRDDVMKWLEKSRETYDLIFLDPPTHSRSKRMDEDFDIQRDHVKLLQLTAARLARDGTLLFSNNYRRFKLDEPALPRLLHRGHQRAHPAARLRSQPAHPPRLAHPTEELMEKPDYGLDAPGVIRNLGLGGLAFLAVALGLVLGNGQSWMSVLGFLVAATVLFGEVVAMIWSSRSGKFMARDRLLANLKLQGNERVLDVGCGHGLLLIGAAKLVPQGRAVGIDLWSQEDQGKNAQEHTLHNAKLEGVAERVEVQTGDMRKLPFGDGEFDAVVASLSIHNIPNPAGRAEAVARSRAC